MRRTGSAAVALATWLAASGASAAVEVRAEADRSEVGLPDTFVLTIRASDAPRGSNLTLPTFDGVEVLNQSRGVSSSVQFGSGGPVVRQELTVTVLLRPTRVGTLTLPPAELHTPDGVVKGNPVTLTVRKMHLPGPPSRPQRPNLVPGFPSPFGGDDPFAALRDREGARPSSETDLFLRSEVDRKEVYVGEQVTVSVWIFSRVDLANVNFAGMPKLDGFWSEILDNPTSLTAETRTVDGVPYRTYLLKRMALFPVTAGTHEIGPVEADITTGFLFAGHREHRASNPVTIKARSLPPGTPPGFAASNVGTFRLSAELSANTTELGAPVTLRVVLEGQGNMKNVLPPRAVAPAAIKLYEPTQDDRISVVRGRLQGKRTQEYLLVAQQTGTFQIPSIAFAYFDPEARRYETVRTPPLTLTVTPGEADGLRPSSPVAGASDTVRNVLPAGALRPLRLESRFEERRPAWRRPGVVAAALAPPAAWMLLSLVGAVRTRRARRDPASERRRGTRAARGRLAAATRLRETGTDAAFSEQVERALTAFLEARVGGVLTGLTRDALRQRLRDAGAPEAVEERAARVLDTCDAVRFAPGALKLDRAALLDDAAQVLEGWE